MGRTRTGAVLVAALLATVAGAGGASERVHVVQPGETLWTISERLAGDPNRWEELYRANRDQIKDPSTLYPGQRLAIPELLDGGSAVDAEASPEVSSPPRE